MDPGAYDDEMVYQSCNPLEAPPAGHASSEEKVELEQKDTSMELSGRQLLTGGSIFYPYSPTTSKNSSTFSQVWTILWLAVRRSQCSISEENIHHHGHKHEPFCGWPSVGHSVLCPKKTFISMGVSMNHSVAGHPSVTVFFAQRRHSSPRVQAWTILWLAIHRSQCSPPDKSFRASTHLKRKCHHRHPTGRPKTYLQHLAVV